MADAGTDARVSLRLKNGRRLFLYRTGSQQRTRYFSRDRLRSV